MLSKKLWIEVFLQIHRTVEVGRGLWRSSCPAHLIKQHHLQQATQDHVQTAFEYLRYSRYFSGFKEILHWEELLNFHCSPFLLSNLLHTCLSFFALRRDQIFGWQDYIFKCSIYCPVLLDYCLYHASLQRPHWDSFLWCQMWYKHTGRWALFPQS